MLSMLKTEIVEAVKHFDTSDFQLLPREDLFQCLSIKISF